MTLKTTTREKVSQAIENAIKTISGIQSVDRQHYENFNNYAYPSAFINEVREEIRTICDDLVLVTARYSVVLFDKTATGKGNDLSTKLNSLIEEGRRALLNDRYLNDEVEYLEIVSIDTDAGFLFPHCVALLGVLVKYLRKIE